MKIQNIIKLILFSIFISSNLLAERQVGVIVPLTGSFARYGNKIIESIKKTKLENIKYLYEDEGCNPKLAVSAYEKLSSVNKVNIFLGPWCGSPQVALAPMINKDNKLAILGSSSPRSLFKSSCGRMFSTQPSIEEESYFNANKAYELGARKVAIIFLENSFSRAHEKAFREEFRGEVIKTLTYDSPDASALKSLSIQIRKLKPDTLYIPDAFPLMHGLLKVISSAGIKVDRIFSVYSAQSQDVLNAIGSDGEGLMISYPRIGNKVALHYFPKKAAKIVNKIIKNCGDKDTDCAIKFLNNNYSFDEYGVLKTDLGLKVVRDGSFIWKD